MRRDERERVFVGSCDFHRQRVGEDWRIDLFRFNLKFIDGHRKLENEPIPSSEP